MTILVITFIFFKIILDCIFLFFIFRKANIKEVNAFIPFVNAYYYFKLCKLPFWTLFVPLINVIVIFFSTYNIMNTFKQKRYLCWISILFPDFFLGYLAFSKVAMPTDFNIVPAYVRTIEELTRINDILEKNSISDEFYIIPDEAERFVQQKSNEFNNMIDDLENALIQDDILFDDNELIEKVNTVVAPNILEITQELEYFDDPDDYSLAKNVDILEKNLEINSGVKRIDTADYKEYSKDEPSSEAIAFGGKEKKENPNMVKAKVEEFKCERCGSSLVGAINICPGCGTPI